MNNPRQPGPPPLEPYPSFEERAYGQSGAQHASQNTLRAPARRPGGPARRPRKKRFGWGSAVFVLFLGIIAVVSGIGVFLVTNPPTDLIRAQLIDQVKQRTGRTLTIAGPTKFTIIPSLGLSMKDVTLSPPPGMSGPAFAKMAGLDVSVRLLPLLKREVSVNQLVLQQPVLNFQVDGKGRKSWDFASLYQVNTPVRIAQAGQTATDAPGGLPADAQEFLQHSGDARKKPNAKKIAALSQLQLGDVRIVNGTVHYSDARDGTKHHLGAVNLRLGLDNIKAPLDATGNLQWRRQKIDLTSRLTSVNDILLQKPAQLEFKLNSKPVSARYDGSIHIADVVAAKGAVAMNSPSLRKMAGWVGTTLPPARGFGPLKLTGLLDSKGATHRLSSAKVNLDNQMAQGTIVVKTGASRPYVNADLKLSQLDLNNYLSDGTQYTPATNTAIKTAPAQPTAATPQSINDLLDPAGTRVKGYTQRSGWGRDKINTDALGAADVDAKLVIDRLFVKNLKIGRSDLAIALKNKSLKTTINEIALYDGRGTGIINAQAIDGGAAVGVDLTLTGVEARTLLRDVAQQDWLAGKGTVKIAVVGQGASQQQIMNALNGNANMAFKDGAIVGVNIPKLIRGVSQGNFLNLSGSPAEKTDFSSMTASWAIRSGVAQNQDLKLVSPLMRVAGEGDVMIGAQQIDYLVRPKLVSSLEGQGAQGVNSGLEIPVRIKGPWAKPQIQPQVGDILANPDKAIDAVKKLGEQFKGKNAGELLDGLLGGGQNGSSGDKKANPAGDLLDRFLR